MSPTLMMSPTLIFWPAFAQVLLTVIVLLAMGRARAASMRTRKQSLDDIAMNRPTDWDEQATKAANLYKNHFEMPVLFFACIACALALQINSPILVGLAWLFVATRAVQSYVHLGANQVTYRGSAFLIGALTVLVMWIMLALSVARLG
jgi:hypothetical protein